MFRARSFVAQSSRSPPACRRAGRLKAAPPHLSCPRRFDPEDGPDISKQAHPWVFVERIGTQGECCGTRGLVRSCRQCSAGHASCRRHDCETSAARPGPRRGARQAPIWRLQIVAWKVLGLRFGVSPHGSILGGVSALPRWKTTATHATAAQEPQSGRGGANYRVRCFSIVLGRATQLAGNAGCVLVPRSRSTANFKARSFFASGGT